MDRHYTVSGFVVHEGRTALHWHRKLDMWLPAGGHVEPNEDPVEAVLREVAEEFSVEAEIIPMTAYTDSGAGPRAIQPPYTIQNCLIEPGHEHIDFIYFLNLTAGYPGVSHDPDNPIVWLSAEELQSGAAGHNGRRAPFTADVQTLGLEAIRHAAALAVRP